MTSAQPFTSYLSSPISGNFYSRLRDRTLLFRYLVIITLIFGAWYLHWRLTSSINWQYPWISIPLFIAELYCYIGGVIFYLGLWRPVMRQVRSLQEMRPLIPEEQLPTVDVFITCYNEPVDLVEKTAAAALQLDYPLTKLAVYILDDGASPEMKAMSDRLSEEDLRSPGLQKILNQLKQTRLSYVNQLEELKALESDLKIAEVILDKAQLQVRSQPSDLDLVLDWFEPLKQDFIPSAVWFTIMTALGEAFDNILEHAHRHLPIETPIFIQLTIFSERIQLKLWDQGTEFDLEQYLESTTDNMDSLEEEGGRGLLILKSLADHLSYVRTEQGNCLTVIKDYEPTTEALQEPDRLRQGLYSLRQLITLGKQPSFSLKDEVQSQQKNIEQKIRQTEKAIKNLPRCHYIARPKPKGKPHYAKAGNINHAIFSGQTNGDLVVTFDADHIPKSHYLQRVVPYFFQYNLQSGEYQLNRVAFVQTPQAFSNLPPNDLFGHDAHLFYGPIQQAKDGMNSAFYTGTNATLRREALVSMGLQNFALEFEKDTQRLEDFELIGGVSSISITEDMNTAMRLHAAGWRSVYHHEVLAEGLAPDDLGSTMKQKLRWAQGTIQVLYRDNPLTKPGLSFWQRWQYFQTMYSYFSGFFILFFLISPILYFFTGVTPLQANSIGSLGSRV